MEALFSRAAEKNKQPITEALKGFLTGAGTILEVASGSGQHVACFALEFEHWQWLPTEYQLEKVQSINLYRERVGAENIVKPMQLDVCELPWEVPQVNAILNINMVHASKKSTAPALFEGARHALLPNGMLFLYGPFKFKQKPTAPSNLEFDAYWKTLNKEFGLWYLEDLEELALKNAFSLYEVLDMPSNNHFVVFR